jgi:threonylcarbamoyladenosine tRNA methylthiotransferase MtaB
VPTAALTTLGCKVNQYETQRILDSFEAAGFQIVPFDGPADVYVVNTCSVTGQAESKSRYTVRRARRGNPAATVVVTGCAGQMSVNSGEAFEGADVLVPNPEKLQALEWLGRSRPGLLDAASQAPRAQPAPPGRTRATLKVQDGCDVMCSYCSIPFTRPGMSSRPWREVLAEAQSLALAGYQEAVLTGVLIGAYGPATGSDGPDFDGLVRLLAVQSGLTRIRISSIEAHQVSDAVVSLAADGLVAPHFHVPLQSGDSGVLRDMGRRYSAEEYLALCERLYRAVPDVSLTTDVMVGFPTENQTRFQTSCQTRFLKAHVFRFSPRPGTPADAWGDPVSPPEKQARAAAVARIAAESGRRHVRSFVGRTVRVVAESRQREGGLLEGTSDNGLTVRFAGPTSAARTIVWVRLDDERDGVAFGEMAEPPSGNRLRILAGADRPTQRG